MELKNFKLSHFIIGFCLNSTMFRWNKVYVYEIDSVQIEFKFHYVQMEQFFIFKIFVSNKKSLNSTMFRWNSRNTEQS